MSNLPAAKAPLRSLRWRYTICVWILGTTFLATVHHYFRLNELFFIVAILAFYAAAFIVLPQRYPRLFTPPKPAK